MTVSAAAVPRSGTGTEVVATVTGSEQADLFAVMAGHHPLAQAQPLVFALSQPYQPPPIPLEPPPSYDLHLQFESVPGLGDLPPDYELAATCESLNMGALIDGLDLP